MSIPISRSRSNSDSLVSCSESLVESSSDETAALDKQSKPATPPVMKTKTKKSEQREAYSANTNKTHYQSTQDIKKEFEILLNELKQYNPELLDKKRILAISKSDMLDEELQQAIRKELPADIPFVFISSIMHQGIQELKDLIWKSLH